MSKITLLFDGVTEEVAVLKDDEEVICTCKDYETDFWVKAIVEELGGEYERIKDAERLLGSLESQEISLLG